MNEPQNSNGSNQQGQPNHGAPRRGFTRDFKNKIPDEIEALKKAGLSVGDFLRREGLYSSQVSNWRRLRKEGLLASTARGRGRPKLSVRAEAQTQLEARNRALDSPFARKSRNTIDLPFKMAQTVTSLIELPAKAGTLRLF